MRLQIALCFAAMAGLYPGSTAIVPPANDTVSTAIRIDRGTHGPLSGNSEQATNDYDPGSVRRGGSGPPEGIASGASDTEGVVAGRAAAGRDVVYRLDLHRSDEVALSYDLPMSDAVLYVMREGAAPGVCCAWSDQAGIGVSEQVNFRALEDGVYYVVLDAKERNSGGPWDFYYSIQCASSVADAGAGVDWDRPAGAQTEEVTWGAVKGLFR